jgi:hypothetical protein
MFCLYSAVACSIVSQPREVLSVLLTIQRLLCTVRERAVTLLVTGEREGHTWDRMTEKKNVGSLAEQRLMTGHSSRLEGMVALPGIEPGFED